MTDDSANPPALNTVVPPEDHRHKQARSHDQGLPVLALGAGPDALQSGVVVAFRHPQPAPPDLVSYFALSPEGAKLLAADLENALGLLKQKK